MGVMPVAITVVLVVALAGASWLFYKMYTVNQIAPFVVVGLLVVLTVASYFWLNWPVTSDVVLLNADGAAGTALVVYHPGKSGFHRDVTEAFANGLASNGWRVELATASAEAPTDLSGYDLLVLGGPTYYFIPNRPTVRYLSSLGDLAGKRTVTIVTGLGAAGGAAAALESQVREANGDLVDGLLLFTLRPNEDRYGLNDAVQIATQAGQAIGPAGE